MTNMTGTGHVCLSVINMPTQLKVHKA